MPRDVRRSETVSFSVAQPPEWIPEFRILDMIPESWDPGSEFSGPKGAIIKLLALKI